MVCHCILCAERDASLQVFIHPLRTANVITEKTDEFFHEVFWNLDEVLSFHQRMLASLFERQRDQHPLILSIADIILESESHIPSQ